MHYGENFWAGVKAHLDAVTEHAAAPVIAKYTGVLAGADIEIFTRTTTFPIMQSIRLDRGFTVSTYIYPRHQRPRGRVGGLLRAGVQLDWGWRAADDKVAVVDLYDGWRW